MFKTKKILPLSWRQTLALIGLGLLIVISRLGQVPAQSVIQGYNSDENLQTGMIVGLNQTDATKVEATTTQSVERMDGVVVNASDATVALSSPNQKVFVASNGRYTVLVSNQNGAIRTNDYISISSLPGIGMRARTDQSFIVGRAVGSFDGTHDVVGTKSVKEAATTKQVALGKIAVDINLGRNPWIGSGGAYLPGFLQSAGNSIAGKSVSVGKIYLAAALLLISAIIAGSLLYASVRSSIIAIGRNPLSKRSIVSSLMQVVATSLIIFVAGLFGVYLLLKL